VILLTSLSAPQDIIQGLESGADNFVVKPYAEEFLLSRVRTILATCNDDSPDRGLTVQFAGQRYVITSDRRQILNLLLSTYETAVQTNRDLIRAHEELKAAQAQLIEAEKLQSVGRLAAGVAHEVRNPLAILEMGLGFLSDQPVGDDGRLILGEMQEAVRRANEVITSLMDLSSPRQMGMRAANLNEIIEQALTEMQGELSRTGIEVVRELAPALPASSADAGKLEQVFINVLTNAVQAMPTGGTLGIASAVKKLAAGDIVFDAGARGGAKFREGESVIAIRVRDSGRGIAAEHLGKVFDPFFSTKPTGQGMGLGLTVAKKIVELHHGCMDLSNADSGGVEVNFIFKIA